MFNTGFYGPSQFFLRKRFGATVEFTLTAGVLIPSVWHFFQISFDVFVCQKFWLPFMAFVPQSSGGCIHSLFLSVI